MASLEDAYASLAQHGLHATRAAVTELVLQDSDKQTLVRAILADISSGLAVAHPGDSRASEAAQGGAQGGGGGGGGGESRCAHGKQRGKCRACRGAQAGESSTQERQRQAGEQAAVAEQEMRGRASPPTRAEKKCEHNRRKRECKDCGGASICAHYRVRSKCQECKRRRAELAAVSAQQP
jgi:hypothetical protein